tara:strand:- start:923 stop:1198 length:276 start_codon:yes stop_codon:yes gene_type:complete
MKTKIDMVNQPPHYQGDIECIDYIQQQLGDNFRYYLEGTAIKYLHRFKYKDKEIEDLQKNQWYVSKLIEELERLETKFKQELMTEARKFIE